MPDFNATSTAGVAAKGYREGSTSTDPWVQYVAIKDPWIETFRGRCATFVTPGRAVTTQRLMAIHNATGSAVLARVNRVVVDVLQTAVKAQTIIPPLIRLHRFKALPTGGTSLAKVGLDTNQTSDASITLWGDSSADCAAQAGTLSASALTIVNNPSTPIAQIEGPRLITAAGYEMVDTAQFLNGEVNVILRALEGLAVTLDLATATTGNPATDKWVAYMDWTEYTQP